jgi:hypothetical protein
MIFEDGSTAQVVTPTITPTPTDSGPSTFQNDEHLAKTITNTAEALCQSMIEQGGADAVYQSLPEDLRNPQPQDPETQINKAVQSLEDHVELDPDAMENIRKANDKQ